MFLAGPVAGYFLGKWLGQWTGLGPVPAWIGGGARSGRAPSVHLLRLVGPDLEMTAPAAGIDAVIGRVRRRAFVLGRRSRSPPDSPIAGVRASP